MKAGPKFTYDVAKFDAIINSITQARGSLGQVADFNKIPRDTFYYWLRVGEEDRNNGLSTELAQLSSNLRHAQAIVVMDLVEEGISNEKRSKFIMWWLSKICREDFGAEGVELKELRDIFPVILPLINKDDSHAK